MPSPVSTQDLLHRLLRGEQLVKCHGVGWQIGPDAERVPDVLVYGIEGSHFRLTLGRDGLPGLGNSQTMRLERVATSEDLLFRLRREIREAGSLSEYARRHGASKGQVGNVESCALPMTAGVAQLLGHERILHLWRPISQGKRT